MMSARASRRGGHWGERGSSRGDPVLLARMRRLRWTGFGLVVAAFILSFFHRIAPAALSGELRSAFRASSVELGALAATYFLVYTLMQVPTGVLVDALGPRRLVAAGGVVAGIGSIVFGLAPTLLAASAGRALIGLGVSVAFVCLLKLNAAWFREREFATLSGLVMFLGNLGAVLSAAPLAWAASVVSWRTIFVAIGVSSIIGAVLTWLAVHDDPRHAGLPTVRELDGLPPHDGAPSSSSWYAGLSIVARNPSTWPGFFVNMGIAGTFLAFAGLWAVPFLMTDHGMSRARATAHTSVMLLAFAFSCLFVGRLSDRLRRRRAPMIVSGLVYLLCWIPWVAGVHAPLAVTIALFAAMGFAVSGFTLSWATVKEVNPPAFSGTAMALVNTGVFLGPTIYQPLVGWVLDHAGQRAALAVLAGFAAMGFLATLFVRETRARNLTA